MEKKLEPKFWEKVPSFSFEFKRMGDCYNSLRNRLMDIEEILPDHQVKIQMLDGWGMKNILSIIRDIYGFKYFIPKYKINMYILLVKIADVLWNRIEILEKERGF